MRHGLSSKLVSNQTDSKSVTTKAKDIVSPCDTELLRVVFQTVLPSYLVRRRYGFLSVLGIEYVFLHVFMSRAYTIFIQIDLYLSTRGSGGTHAGRSKGSRGVGVGIEERSPDEQV